MEKRAYISLDPVTRERPAVLITESKTLTFPLLDEDLEDIKILVAPQIGIAKKIIVFSAPEADKLFSVSEYRKKRAAAFDAKAD
jgi:hypothetical protein